LNLIPQVERKVIKQYNTMAKRILFFIAIMIACYAPSFAQQKI